MKRSQMILSALALWAGADAAYAGPRVGISVGIGMPYYRPYYPVYAPYYYRPYAVYVEPAPVVLQPAPIVVRPAATVVEAPYAPAPVGQNYVAPMPSIVQSASSPASALGVFIQQLNHPDENARRDAATELGRLRSEQAVDPLTATLAGDGSPRVREAAARALALIGSPRALTALANAARADSDSNVRNSAQFAVEIIQTNRR